MALRSCSRGDCLPDRRLRIRRTPSGGSARTRWNQRSKASSASVSASSWEATSKRGAIPASTGRSFLRQAHRVAAAATCRHRYEKRSFDRSYGKETYCEATGNVNRLLQERIGCRRRDHDIFARPVSCPRMARKSFGNILLPWRDRPFSEVLFYSAQR